MPQKTDKFRSYNKTTSYNTNAEMPTYYAFAIFIKVFSL